MAANFIPDTLAAQTDVVITTPANGHALIYNGTASRWQNQAIPATDWTAITNKPATFTPSSHSHTISDVTNLQTALDGKASSSHTHAQADVTNLTTDLAAKAPLASPTFTGVPAAPTAAANTNTTQLATTAFVIGQASNATPLISGTATAGTLNTYSRADHVHPTDTTRAALASPAFTGGVTVTATTSSTVPFVISAVASQTANLLQIKDSTNATRLLVDNTYQFGFPVSSGGPVYFGNFGSNSSASAGFSVPSNVIMSIHAANMRMGFGGGGIHFFNNSPDSLVEIRGKANEVQLGVRAHSTQTSNIQEWRSSGGTVLSAVNPSGQFVLMLAYRAITGARTLDNTDCFIDCTSGTFNVTLPTAVGIAGREYIIKNSGAGTITVATTSSQTIDGSTTYSLSTQYSRVNLVSDGANWKIIGT
jgi:hypothetical protein